MNDLEAQYRYYECVIRLHELEYDFEIRGNGQNYTKGEHGRFTGSKPAGGSGKVSLKGLTNTKQRVIMRIDMEGKPFDFPAVVLPTAEYSHVCSEISTHWHTKYKGYDYGEINFSDKTYYFENRRFGDYNIYKVKKRK